MTVAELIEHLKQFDPNLRVVTPIYSEQEILTVEHVRVISLCEARPDGWVENERPDKPTVDYLAIGY